MYCQPFCVQHPRIQGYKKTQTATVPDIPWAFKTLKADVDLLFGHSLTWHRFCRPVCTDSTPPTVILNFWSEIQYSKHFPLQSSLLLCFVATIVSISYFQSLVSMSALSSCLYVLSNRVEALMACWKIVWNITKKNLGRKEENIFIDLMYVKFDLWFEKIAFMFADCAVIALRKD